MNKIAASLFLSGMFLSAYGADRRPSEAALTEFFEVAEVKTFAIDSQNEMELMIKRRFRQQFANRQLNSDQQQAIDKAEHKLIDLFRKQASWEVLLPRYIKVYQEALTREDVDAWIAFYKSQAGQTYAKKIPELTKSLQADMQARLPLIASDAATLERELANELATLSGR